jgi:hypothetical protein
VICRYVNLRRESEFVCKLIYETRIAQIWWPDESLHSDKKWKIAYVFSLPATQKLIFISALQNGVITSAKTLIV